MSVKSAEIIKVLFNMGVMATINQILDQDTTTLLIEELGHKAIFVSDDAIEEELAESFLQRLVLKNAKERQLSLLWVMSIMVRHLF